MADKYKIICVTDAIKSWNSHEQLEREVNTFLNSNNGYFPHGGPIVVGSNIMQVLVKVDLLDG